MSGHHKWGDVRSELIRTPEAEARVEAVKTKMKEEINMSAHTATHLSRTTDFGECLTCGERVTEKATEHFTNLRVIRHNKWVTREFYLGVTHPTCDEPHNVTLSELVNEIMKGEVVAKQE